MLDRGLSEDGAAQALGWPKARVTARMRLLELPDRAQRMVGAGELPLSCVDVVRQIGAVSRPIQELVVEYIDHDDTAWARDRLEAEAGWVIGQAIQAIGTSKTWAEYLTGFGTRDVAELKLGKVAEQQMAAIDELCKRLNPYAYGSQLVRFIDAEIDQARAAGVLVEFEHGAPTSPTASCTESWSSRRSSVPFRSTATKLPRPRRPRRRSASAPAPRPTTRLRTPSALTA